MGKDKLKRFNENETFQNLYQPTLQYNSEQSELILLRVLKILNENNIEIEDLSAVPTNLEDVFLKMMRENASSN